MVRRVLTWWYHRKVRRDEGKLKELLKKRKKILDDVMETETYKVAKEILEKFAPEQLISRTAAPSAVRSPVGGQARPGTMGGTPMSGAPGSEMRRRFPQQPGGATPGAPMVRGALTPAGPGGPGRPGPGPMGPRGASPQLPTGSMAISGGPRGSAAASTSSSSAFAQRQVPSAGMGSSVVPAGTRPMQAVGRERGTELTNCVEGTQIVHIVPRLPGMPGPPLPRPVLPRERGYMDRMVEYLVGDGPANRYALICKQCQSHNGMALKEEFEYIGEFKYVQLFSSILRGNSTGVSCYFSAYRCCYCYFWNPARKQRPVAPKLQVASPRRKRSDSSSSSSSESNAATPSSSPKPRGSGTALSNPQSHPAKDGPPAAEEAGTKQPGESSVEKEEGGKVKEVSSEEDRHSRDTSEEKSDSPDIEVLEKIEAVEEEESPKLEHKGDEEAEVLEDLAESDADDKEGKRQWSRDSSSDRDEEDERETENQNTTADGEKESSPEAQPPQPDQGDKEE